MKLFTLFSIGFLAAVSTANADPIRQFECKNVVGGSGSIILTIGHRAKTLKCDLTSSSGVIERTGILNLLGYQQSAMIYKGNLASADNSVEVELVFSESLIQAEVGAGNGVATLNGVSFECSERSSH